MWRVWHCHDYPWCNVCRTSQPLSVGGMENEGGKFTVGGQELNREESRNARLLYDYDALNPDEISANAGTVSV